MRGEGEEVYEEDFEGVEAAGADAAGEVEAASEGGGVSGEGATAAEMGLDGDEDEVEVPVEAEGAVEALTAEVGEAAPEAAEAAGEDAAEAEAEASGGEAAAPEAAEAAEAAEANDVGEAAQEKEEEEEEEEEKEGQPGSPAPAPQSAARPQSAMAGTPRTPAGQRLRPMSAAPSTGGGRFVGNCTPGRMAELRAMYEFKPYRSPRVMSARKHIEILCRQYDYAEQYRSAKEKQIRSAFVRKPIVRWTSSGPTREVGPVRSYQEKTDYILEMCRRDEERRKAKDAYLRDKYLQPLVRPRTAASSRPGSAATH